MVSGKHWSQLNPAKVSLGAKIFIGLAVVAGVGKLILGHHTDAHNRNSKTAEMCMDWRIETPLEKHFDGPYLR